MAGINIPFLSDVRDFLRGTGDVEDGLDEVADSLDGLGDKGRDAGRDTGRGLSEGVEGAARDVDRSADKIGESLDTAFDGAGDSAKDAARDVERHIEGAGDDVSRETERMERSFKDAFDAVKPAAKGAGDDVGRSMKGGTDKAVNASEEFRDEAKSNISEVASSFSGDMDSAVDVVQGTLGGLASNLGPAGLFGAAILAGGIGLLKATLEGDAEAALELKERVIELADELEEVAGNTAALDWAAKIREASAEITDAKSWWEVWQDEPKTWLDEQADAARRAGIDFGTWAAGMAGESTNAEAAIQQLDQRIADLQERNAEIARQTPDVEGIYSAHALGATAGSTAVDDEVKSLTDLRDQMAESLTTTEAATERHDLLTDAIDRTSDAAIEAQESQESYAGAVVDSLTEAAEAWEDYTEDGVLNLDEYNAAIEKQYEAVRAYEENMVRASSTLSEEALNYIRSLGPEAAPLLQAYIDAPLDQQTRTAENWDRVGQAATDGYRSGLAGVTTETDDAITNAQARADARHIKMRAYLDDGDLQWQVNTAADRIRPPVVPVYARVYNEVA